MNRTLSTVLLAAALAAAPAAMAQSSVPVAKAEVKEAKQTLKSDKKDLKEIVKIRKKWEKARATGKRNLEAKTDVALASWVREQVAEGRVKVARAEEDVRAAGGTVVPEGKKGRARGPGTRKRNSGRAAAEAEKYLHAVRVDQKRLIELGERLGEMQGRFTAGSASGAEYRQKSEMLQELHRHAARELERANETLGDADLALRRAKGQR